MERSRKVLGYGIWYFWHCATIFGTVRLFQKKIELFSRARPPAWIIFTTADNLLRLLPACRTLALPTASALLY